MAQGHRVLYEAAAEASGAFARADILLRVKAGQDLWDLFEVKSSGHREEAELAEEKDQFLWDLALQRHAFERSKHGIRKACLVLVNKDFVRQGPVDPKLFFKVEDVSQEVAKRLPQIPALLQSLLLTVAHPQAPQRDIGQHCREPHPCPFQDRCWPAAGPTHIFNLRGLGWAKKFEHFHHGRERIIDYPADQLTPWQAKQVQASSQGQPVVERAALAGFLNGLVYPLYHLDFETINPALPPFDGLAILLNSASSNTACMSRPRPGPSLSTSNSCRPTRATRGPSSSPSSWTSLAAAARCWPTTWSLSAAA